jgi:hypothetical protein
VERGGLDARPKHLAAGTAPSDWRDRPASMRLKGETGMERRSAGSRVLSGLAIAILLAGCSASASPTPPPASLASVAVTTPTPPPTPAAIPTPVPTTAGTGPQYVTGTMVFIPGTEATMTQVGDVQQYRGQVSQATLTMNDQRVSGTATFNAGYDLYGNGALGPSWSNYRLVNAGGAWEGFTAGAMWDQENAQDASGWLVGSGAYKGYTFWIHFIITRIEGIIYPGSPPKA